MSHEIAYVGFGQFPAPVDKELTELRRKVWTLLAIHPMSDPHRVNFAGVPVPREKIDELKVITFPGIIFESLPVVMRKGGLGGVKYYVDTPKKYNATTFVAQLGATAYRIFKTIKGMEIEEQFGTRDGVAKVTNEAPGFLDWKEHWHSSLSPRAGFTSPTTLFLGRPMMVADALMNLAYPCLEGYEKKPVAVRFGMRRRCGVEDCVNPAHYVMTKQSKEYAKLSWFLSTAMIPEGERPKRPVYIWDPIAEEPAFTASWKEFLDKSETYWRKVAKELQPEQQKISDKGIPIDALFAALGKETGTISNAANTVLNKKGK